MVTSILLSILEIADEQNIELKKQPAATPAGYQ
jgi:hypothetical protein